MRVLGIILVAILTGCASTGTPPSHVQSGAVGSAQVSYYTEAVVVGECAFVQREEKLSTNAITTGLISSAISEGLNLIGNMLTEAGRDSAEPTTLATANFELKSDTPMCLQLVRGEVFGKQPNEIPKAVLGEQLKQKEYDKLAKNQLYLAAKPDFLFEGLVLKPKMIDAMTIKPTALWFNKPKERNIFSQSSDRSIAISFTFYGPGKTMTDASNTGTLLTFESVPKGRMIHIDPMERTDPYRGQPNEGQWFTFNQAENGDPLSVAATITETRPGNKFFAFLGRVFEANKENIEQALNEALLDEKRREAEIAKRQERTALLNTLNTDIGKALDALQTCQASGKGNDMESIVARTKKANAAALAIKQANDSAFAAGEPSPFSTSIKVTGAAEEVTGSCEEAVKSFGS